MGHGRLWCRRQLRMVSQQVYKQPNNNNNKKRMRTRGEGTLEFMDGIPERDDIFCCKYGDFYSIFVQRKARVFDLHGDVVVCVVWNWVMHRLLQLVLLLGFAVDVAIQPDKRHADLTLMFIPFHKG